MKYNYIQIATLVFSVVTGNGVLAQEHVSSRVIQACYTDKGVSPQITTFLKEHTHGANQHKTYSLVVNRFEEGEPETLFSSGYRPVMIEENLIHNPLFEISLTLTSISRAGLKSRNLAEGYFTDPIRGRNVHFETELECVVRNPEFRDWVFTSN